MNNEEEGVTSLLGLILFFSVFSVIAMSGFLLEYGVMNDFLFYETQLQVESMVTDGIINSSVANQTQMIFETFLGVISWEDNLWFGIYLLFVVTSLLTAYSLRGSNAIPFLMYLLFGITIFLFLGGILETFTDWFVNSITTKIIPDAWEYFPKFAWYLDNIGVVNLIHATILLLLTKSNFDFSRKNNNDKNELNAIRQSGEVF